jgi:hypothetical protein
LGVFGDEGELFGLRLDHLLQFWEAFLKLLLRWRVLAYSADQLHGVEPCLIASVIEQSNNLVKLVQVIDLNLSLFLLGKRGQSPSGCSPNI